MASYRYLLGGRLPALPPCRLLFRCGQGAHQEPAEGAAEAVSAASYRFLLGAVFLPCHPAALSSLRGQDAHQELAETADVVEEVLVANCSVYSHHIALPSCHTTLRFEE
ncbi:hypothetical protein NDU88_007077 [Pleurodeles waltl]|uniref:Uncharacterized protein n=1 Tax=Pleurodeles waltl TaxID=8319 RepID=A0AAV7SRQ0_PLEWA|nr:hypothetical protein NDU88_007077 [Pleurodeles waltl]